MGQGSAKGIYAEESEEAYVSRIDSFFSFLAFTHFSFLSRKYKTVVNFSPRPNKHASISGLCLMNLSTSEEQATVQRENTLDNLVWPSRIPF